MQYGVISSADTATKTQKLFGCSRTADAARGTWTDRLTQPLSCRVKISSLHRHGDWTSVRPNSYRVYYTINNDLIAIARSLHLEDRLCQPTGSQLTISRELYSWQFEAYFKKTKLSHSVSTSKRYRKNINNYSIKDKNDEEVVSFPSLYRFTTILLGY